MTVRKRLLRKPFTTALWLLLTAAMSAFLLLGIALYLSTGGMVRDLDENHTAIAARMDPPRLLTGEAQKREFTKEDAAWFEGLSSVKALRIHTVSAASSPLFHPLVEMNRHEGWRSNGDRTPYCHAVLSGTVVWIGQDQSDDYFSPGYFGGLGDSVDSGDLEQTVEMTVELEEVLLLGKEYVDSLAESALRYRKQFLVEFTPQDEAAASYFRQGERYVFSGYFDPGALLGISMDVFMKPTVMLLHLGGTRSGQGFLMGGYENHNWDGEDREVFLTRETPYAFPAAEALTGSSESFFEETDHEIWRELKTVWEKQQGSLPVIGTDKLETLYSFLSQRAVIQEGRAFTEEEYERGEKVLLLSRQMAKRAGLNVGDTLTLQQYNGAFDREHKGALSAVSLLDGVYYGRPVNNPGVDVLNMQTAYGPEEIFTLVGIYELEENWAEGSYDFTPNTVIMPKKAQIAGALGEIPEKSGEEDPDYYGLPLSIELVNGKVGEFQAAVEASPYGGQFYAFDQGYEAVQKNLMATLRSMGRLLALSLLGWSFFLILYLLMYQGREKQTLGTLRSLGRSPFAAGCYLWSGGFATALPGILLGILTGGILIKKMQDGILADALAGLDPNLEGDALLAAREELRSLMEGSRLKPEQLLLVVLFLLLTLALALLIHSYVLARREPRRLMEG